MERGALVSSYSYLESELVASMGPAIDDVESRYGEDHLIATSKVTNVPVKREPLGETKK